MVQMIIDTYGRDAIAAIAAAWRDGADDAEALEAGTGVTLEQLYDDYFASFGVQAPTAVEPAPILPSDVDKPPQPAASGDAQPAPSAEPVDPPDEAAADVTWIVAIVAAGLAVGVVVALVVRRRRPPPGPA